MTELNAPIDSLNADIAAARRDITADFDELKARVATWSLPIPTPRSAS